VFSGSSLAGVAEVAEFSDLSLRISINSKSSDFLLIRTQTKDYEMTKNFKRSAIVAASAATVLSLAVATPSFAHQGVGSKSSTSETRVAPVAHTEATLPVTITDIPATVTQIGKITKGAKFVAYALAADATAIPATQPTTGGKPAKVEASIGVDSKVSYALEIHVPVTAGTTKFAVYNAAGVGAFVTVTVDAAGVATATTSAALTAAYVEPTKPALGEGKGFKGERGFKKGHRR
jgi:hypothetical protein